MGMPSCARAGAQSTGVLSRPCLGLRDTGGLALPVRSRKRGFLRGKGVPPWEGGSRLLLCARGWEVSLVQTWEAGSSRLCREQAWSGTIQDSPGPPPRRHQLSPPRCQAFYGISAEKIAPGLWCWDGAV